MIESIILTAAVTYTVTTLSIFNSYLNMSYSQAKIIHETNKRIEVEQAERIIRQDAENLAREIENLTRKEPLKVDVAGIEKVNKEIRETVKGFEGNRMEIFALTTTCYSFASMHKKPLWRLLEPGECAPINHSNNN